ncbi:MAG: hypothetical protein KGL38_03650 [Gemmatimonadota bacterium]|nr:hypothetical protein [Gemmatimonadota bacterium]MDE3127073.1 hypothetical protein [Gemmatimonadota bacterium]MDE3174069.1 hypothetical protein [Gemmatimonadota bacterium]MDE3216233.1 hypothetical protein [Gemmatimonadota bacterium]
MSDFSRRAQRGLAAVAAALSLLAAGCTKGAPQPKTPLSQMAAGQADTTNPHTTMSPAARAALDSGNTLYRAGKYADALKAYQDASAQAPLNAAPYFGVYMAAGKLGNKKLADSALAEYGKRSGTSPEALNDSTLKSVHEAPAKKN